MGLAVGPSIWEKWVLSMEKNPAPLAWAALGEILNELCERNLLDQKFQRPVEVETISAFSDLSSVVLPSFVVQMTQLKGILVSQVEDAKRLRSGITTSIATVVITC